MSLYGSHPRPEEDCFLHVNFYDALHSRAPTFELTLIANSVGKIPQPQSIHCRLSFWHCPIKSCHFSCRDTSPPDPTMADGIKINDTSRPALLHASNTHPELIKFSYLSRTALFRHIKSNAQLYDYRCRCRTHAPHIFRGASDKVSDKGFHCLRIQLENPFPRSGADTRLDEETDLHHITSHTHLEMVIIYDTALDFLHVLPERQLHPTRHGSPAASKSSFGSAREQVSGRSVQHRGTHARSHFSTHPCMMVWKIFRNALAH